MALLVGGVAALIPFIKNVALFALIGLLFVFVGNAEGQCSPSTCHGLCCGDDCTVGTSCFNRLCQEDRDCSNIKESPLSCCTNKCVFGASCVGRSCSLFSDCSIGQTCCHSKCVQGIGCAGQRCVFGSDCSENQACCNSKCVAGKNCLGQLCDSHFDCSTDQSCCNGKCKSGSSCHGGSCSSKSDCQLAENCCRGTCSKGDCVNIAYIVVPVAVFVLLLSISIILVYRRYSRRRQLMTVNYNTREVSTAVLTEEITTSITEAPVAQSNTVYQPEGPPSDQQTVPYTESDDNFRTQPHQRENLIILI